jgi:hypothetical protein
MKNCLKNKGEGGGEERGKSKMHSKHYTKKRHF